MKNKPVILKGGWIKIKWQDLHIVMFTDNFTEKGKKRHNELNLYLDKVFFKKTTGTTMLDYDLEFERGDE